MSETVSLQTPLFLLFIFFLILPFHGNSQTSNPEQTILLKLKQHWSNPPSINHWTPSSNSNSTHCSWPEITCTDGSVTEIVLININLTTTIPPFICDLQNLTHIDVQNNYIPGTFPTALYNCSKLQYLDISQNYFVGFIPGDVNRLSTQLRYLSISRNNFTGDIPSTIGLLPELQVLQLSRNLFNGSFPPEIGNLSNLEVLKLEFNNFMPSTLPSSFGRLKKLRELWMRVTNLVGEIPETIGNLTALEFLDLSTNDLTGDIPSGSFSMKNLTIIYLSENRLSGMIPRTIEALNLMVICLSKNNLTGTIPEDFGKLTKLTQLVLFSNQLSGEIPTTVGSLPALSVFHIYSNNLSGELPPDFGQYSMLKYFEVPDNQFSGRLAEFLCHNGVLARVIAYNNNLSGELPKSLGNCMSLISVRLHGNRFSGNMPTGLWTSFNLTHLMLSNNFFTGHLPDELGANLSRLEISNNQFSGEIPAGISSWRSLTVFRASNNLFNGTIPQELTALPALTTLVLDGNRFSGQFPSEIFSWESLNTLNLSRNRLSGQIPAEIGSLPHLTELDLSGNELSGQIPPEIGNLRLTSLNLSSNLLTGRIPVEFENAAFDSSFLNNSDLCAINPSLGIDVCSSKPRKSNRISSQLFAILICILAVMFILALLFGFYMIWYHGRRKGELDSRDSTWKLTSFQRLNFTEFDILSSLIDSNMIGSGGSRKVYRVPVNRSGEFVAVKRIWNSKKLEIQLEQTFVAEVEILSSILHSNIVKLLCCMSSENSKLLVYEYLENCSLDRWLHGRKRRSGVSGSVRHDVLDWPKRLKIAVGAARGLCYMHHDCSRSIIHRDVKSSNILLDSEFNAKIADFGLAKMLIKHGEPNTMSSVAGSFGYFAPEYAYTTRVNEKIDVYSFGVVLLELATGREAIDRGDENTNLADWSWQHIQEDRPITDALDGEIKEQCYLDEMRSVFMLGIICTGTLPSNRPTMKEVLQILLRHNHQPSFAENNGGSEYDAAPLLMNSRREEVLENGNGGLAWSV